MANRMTDVPIGNYFVNIRRRLGRGAFGEVYRGRHQTSGLMVAAKKIELDESYLAEGRAEAEAEAAAMMRLRHHPHLLKVIDSIYMEDKEDKLYEFWLFTELCNLGNLNELFTSRELNMAERLELARQTCVGLAFLHSLTPQVIHRDIKPGNILLHSVGGNITAKLADFGFARNMEKAYISSFAGTPRFVAPELWPAEEGSYLQYGAPADVYSLGVVHGMMVEARKKQPLHSQERASKYVGRDMMLAVARKDTVPKVVTVQAADPPTVRGWKSIIQRMTAVNPKDRPSIDEVEQMLVVLTDNMPRSDAASAASTRSPDADSEVEQLRRQVAELKGQLSQQPAAAAAAVSSRESQLEGDNPLRKSATAKKDAKSKVKFFTKFWQKSEGPRAPPLATAMGIGDSIKVKKGANAKANAEQVPSFPLPPYEDIDMSHTGELVLLHDDGKTVSLYRPDAAAGFTLQWTRPAPARTGGEGWRWIRAVGGGRVLVHKWSEETVLMDEDGNEAGRWQVEGLLKAASSSRLVYKEGFYGDWHLHVYTADHSLFSLKPAAGDGGTWGWPSVSIGPDGRYFVADHYRQQLAAFSPKGERLYQQQTTYRPRYSPPAASPGHVYVMDDDRRRVIRVHAAGSGAEVTTLTARTLQLREDDRIVWVWTGEEDTLYVEVWDKEGNERIITHTNLLV